MLNKELQEARRRKELEWLDEVKSLIKAGVEAGASEKVLAAEQLGVACQRGSLEVVQYLVACRHAEIRASDHYGRTPLHFACMCQQLEVVKYLVSQGADLKAKDMLGHTPLHSACTNEEALEVVKYLVAQGADVDARDNSGQTPLHAVCENDVLEVIQHLLEHGADVEAKDNGGQTPLEFVVEPKTLRYLQNLQALRGWKVAATCAGIAADAGAGTGGSPTPSA